MFTWTHSCANTLSIRCKEPTETLESCLLLLVPNLKKAANSKHQKLLSLGLAQYPMAPMTSSCRFHDPPLRWTWWFFGNWHSQGQSHGKRGNCGFSPQPWVFAPQPWWSKHNPWILPSWNDPATCIAVDILHLAPQEETNAFVWEQGTPILWTIKIYMKLPFRGISHFRTNPNVGSFLSLNQALWVKSSSGVSMVMTPMPSRVITFYHKGTTQSWASPGLETGRPAGFPPDPGTHQKPPWLRCARICHFLPMSFDLSGLFETWRK